MKWLTDLFSAGASTLVDSVGNAIDNIVTSDEERMQLQNALAQIKIEAENKAAELALEGEKLYLADKQDARDMQKVALAQDDLFSKRFVYYFASGIVTVSFVYIFVITFYPIPEQNIRFADTVLGFLLGVGLASIFNYFFGSSKGSKDKGDAINAALKGGN